MSDWLICGVDRSPHARDVVSAAARFACDLGLRLMVAYVGDESKSRAGDRDEPAHVRVDDLQAWMTREPSVRWDTVLRVEYGHPARELLRLARECDARMLVAGSHGHSRLRAVLLAGRSRRLGGRSRCPVLAVPTAATSDLERPGSERPHGAPSVVCGVDDSAAAELVLAHAAEMAWARGARLVLTHVVQAPGTVIPRARPVVQSAVANVRLRAGTRLLEKLAKRLAADESFETRLRFGDPVTEIDRLAATEGADLIVVGSRGHSGVRPAMAGSVSAGLAACGSRPVLIVPETATSGRLRRFCPFVRSGPILAEAS